MLQRELNCNIGEVKLGRGRDVLRATLGSCVGIGLIWRKKKRCALAHCLLPVAPRVGFEITAKYVTQAVPSLLHLLKVPKGSYSELEAIVVGGAAMMGHEEKLGPKGIGHMNTDTALKCLKELGIRIVHLEVGGEAGRQVTLDCETYQYSVRVFEKGAA